MILFSIFDGSTWLTTGFRFSIGRSERKKISSLALCALLYTLCLPVSAQLPARIGYISGTGSASNPGPYVEALRQGLRDLGYVEGKNFEIEFRGAEGKPDRMPSLVTELVQLKVDVLVVPTAAGAIHAAKQATKSIPICHGDFAGSGCDRASR